VTSSDDTCPLPRPKDIVHDGLTAQSGCRWSREAKHSESLALRQYQRAEEIGTSEGVHQPLPPER
jgi:hypothetical protein